MSCHTWQKCDTNNKHKRFVLRGWSARSLCAQSEDLLHGLHSSCTMGGKNQVQRTCRLTNWNKVARRSQNIQFYSCLISEFGWWNGAATCFVLPAVERQKVKKKKEKVRKRKKKGIFNVERCIFNLCHGHKSKSQVLWNMPPHGPTFVLLYSVCSCATLKN